MFSVFLCARRIELRPAIDDRREGRLAVEEVGRHEKADRDLRLDLELRDLRRRVRVAHFVLHVLDHADQRVRPAHRANTQQAKSATASLCARIKWPDLGAI